MLSCAVSSRDVVFMIALLEQFRANAYYYYELDSFRQSPSLNPWYRSLTS